MTIARTAALLTVLLLASMSPAVAADDRIGLSPDGVTWSDELPAPLFDKDFRWVPGDRQVRTFYVRNEDPDPALLSVEILGRAVDSLMDTGDLTVSARGGGGEWQDVSQPGTHRLVSWVDAAFDEPRRIDVAVEFDPRSRNMSMTKRLDLDLRVTLRQDTDAIGDPDGSGGTDGSGSGDSGGLGELLPGTGGAAFWLLVLGLISLLGGTITAFFTRTPARNTPEGPHS